MNNSYSSFFYLFLKNFMYKKHSTNGIATTISRSNKNSNNIIIFGIVNFETHSLLMHRFHR